MSAVPLPPALPMFASGRAINAVWINVNTDTLPGDIEHILVFAHGRGCATVV